MLYNRPEDCPCSYAEQEYEVEIHMYLSMASSIFVRWRALITPWIRYCEDLPEIVLIAKGFAHEPGVSSYLGSHEQCKKEPRMTQYKTQIAMEPAVPLART